ncbi:MAG TPA: class I SAM-dependent methyltransferase [Cellulomonas sp.]
MTERSLSFSRGAQEYAASRPGYPATAVDWAVPAGTRSVLDLAAGTGKLTAALVARGLEVTAVEPSDQMRAILAADLPTVRVLPGTAEATGLPDDAVDAVTVAQAWHWFDAAAATREVARVLRPGGHLTVLWNVRDDHEPWVAEFTRIVHRGDASPVHYRAPDLGAAFTRPEVLEVRWAQPVTTAGLRTLAGTRSFLLTMPDDQREARLAEVDRLAATHPSLAGRPQVPLPYVTHAWRATRL